jgi:hypothetical protein
MERNPVVGKHSVGRLQVFMVLNDEHFDAGIPQSSREKIKLDARAPLNFLPVTVGNFSLEHE